MQLILASASPRRKDLLAAAGYRFVVTRPRLPEVRADCLTLEETVLCNAIAKAFAGAGRYPRAVVLAADTLVSPGGDIIGKPAHARDARKILIKLSGRTHLVCSGVCIVHARKARCQCFAVKSKVRFRRLTLEMVRQYLREVDASDKAGAYAAQEDNARLIAKVEGSFSNVVGLPMEMTARALARFGIVPPGRP